jgi:catechol 2,3-dioxygenase-like lactoylglutathione lyase family enzyme
MLTNAAIMAFLATTDAPRAREFYGDVLGLRFVEDSPYALVFDAGGTMLRIQKVKELEPRQFTELGWNLTDIREVVRVLASRGVSFMRVPFLSQDDQGIWTTPDGSQVAWFTDPDGNTLSLTQLSTERA